jgi:hypothetical protein
VILEQLRLGAVRDPRLRRAVADIAAKGRVPLPDRAAASVAAIERDADGQLRAIRADGASLERDADGA